MRLLQGVPVPLPDDDTRIAAGVIMGPDGPADKFVMVVMGAEHLASLNAVIESALDVMNEAPSKFRAVVYHDMKARLESIHNALTTVAAGWDTDNIGAPYHIHATAEIVRVPTRPQRGRGDIN